MTVPSQAIDALGLPYVADLITRKAHDSYEIEGSDVDLLVVLAARLEQDTPISTEERRWWKREVVDIVNRSKLTQEL